MQSGYSFYKKMFAPWGQSEIFFQQAKKKQKKPPAVLQLCFFLTIRTSFSLTAPTCLFSSFCMKNSSQLGSAIALIHQTKSKGAVGVSLGVPPPVSQVFPVARCPVTWTGIGPN